MVGRIGGHQLGHPVLHARKCFSCNVGNSFGNVIVALLQCPYVLQKVFGQRLTFLSSHSLQVGQRPRRKPSHQRTHVGGLNGLIGYREQFPKSGQDGQVNRPLHV